MEELNKRIGAKARKKYLPLIIIGLIMLLAGAALLGSAIITGSDVEDLNTLTEDQLRTGNTYALVDNNLLIDVFATDNSGAYIILYRSADSKYMGLYLKGSKKRTGESIIEENRKYLTDEADSLSSKTISVKGKLTAMTGDEKQYFQEYFTDGGWSLEEVDRSVDYRTLNTSEDDSMMIIFAVVFQFPCAFGAGIFGADCVLVFGVTAFAALALGFLLDRVLGDGLLHLLDGALKTAGGLWCLGVGTGLGRVHIQVLGVVVLIGIEHRLLLLVVVGLAVEIDVILGRERMPETRPCGVGLVAARSQQNHHRNDH